MPSNFTIKDAIFLILLLCAIVGLFSATITIYKYKNLMANPMGSCMATWNFNTCTCYDSYGSVVPIRSINYNASLDLVPFEPEYKPMEFNFSSIKLGDKNGAGRDNRST